MLTAKEAKQRADDSVAKETHVLEYVRHLLYQIEMATGKGEYNLTVVKTRDNIVTAKALNQLRDLGYTVLVHEADNTDIYISWED